MPRALRTTVNGVSRSGRPTGRAIVMSESPSPSVFAKPSPAPVLRSPRSKRQKPPKTSMKGSRKAGPRVSWAETDSIISSEGSEASREQIHKSTIEQTNTLPSKLKSDTQLDSSDDIEEYDFSSDEEEYDDDMADMADVHSHISLSSDDPPAEYQGIETRPWLSMLPHQRMEYESMFLSVTHPALGQSWTYTEEYQMQIDNMLLLYMQDFPLPTWVSGQDAAERAYRHCNERFRWRQFGIHIYGPGPDRAPDMFRLRTSYPVQPPSAAQPMPQRPGLNDMTMQVQHPPHFIQPGQMAAIVQQAPVPAQITSHLTVPITQAKAGVEITEAQSSPAIAHVQLTQSHAHPPRPRPHQYGSKTSTKTAIKKRKQVATDPPSPRPMTPPYPTRHRPVRPPDRMRPNRTGKTPAQKPAEAESFAWNREIDFRAKAEAATWRDDIYDAETLRIMAEVRKHNEPIIERLDHEVTEKQRLSRNARKKQQLSDLPVDSPARPGRKKKDPNDKSENNDPYHAGYFAFATPEMATKARKLGYSFPEAIMAAGEDNKLSMEDLESIKICWNPGRKGLTYDLKQAPFSVRDHVLTRKQLASTAILNRRAAECIIDFTPNLLWRDVLLRICSEAGCGNKDVRERFCLNGCYADKATFTKRISAALGQKQTQGKSKGYAPGEWEFYEANGEDFKNYIEFFGRRSTTRNMKVGLKRRYNSATADSSGLDDNRLKSDEDDTEEATMSIEPSDDVEMDNIDEADEDDAVSLQDSEALDMLSD